MQIERVEIGKLTGDPANARKHGERNIDTIVQSLNRFGQQKPIVVDSSFCVRAGNGTLEAARSLGWTHLDCVVTDLKGSDAVAYAIADNRTAELAEWDDGVLAAVLEGLQLEGLLESVGFSDDELAELMKDIELDGDGTTGEIEEDEVPEPPDDPITKPGDLWVLGRHRLLCGDSTNVESVSRLLEKAHPFLMVTDPPYGVEYDADWRNEALRSDGSPSDGRAIGKVTNDDRVDWTEAYKLFPGHVAYVWHAGRHASDVVLNLNAAEFTMRCQLIWVKSNFAIGRGHYHWGHEPCWYAVRKGGSAKWCGDRTQSTTWNIAKPSKSETGHSTQKPIECMARPIRNHGDKNDDVYDPFLGSGTTLIASEQLGRTCYGLEISPAYCDVIIKRWENLTCKKAVLDGNTKHANDGKSTETTVTNKARVSGSDSKKASSNNRKPKQQPA